MRGFNRHGRVTFGRVHPTLAAAALAALLIALSALVAAGCTETTRSGPECLQLGDCPNGEDCVRGLCIPRFSDGDLDAEPDAEPAPDGDADALPDGDETPDGDHGPDGDQTPDGDVSPDGDEPPVDGDVPADGDAEPEDEPPVDGDQEADLPRPPGDSCAALAPLRMGEPTYGSTLGASNAIDPGEACTGAALAGADVVYRIRLEAGKAITVTIAPSTPGFNPAIYLLSECVSEPESCLAVADDGRADAPESFQFHPETGGDYYLVVDTVKTAGMDGASGEYVIAVQDRSPVDTCEPCTGEEDDPCGPNAHCVIYSDNEGPIERACGTACGVDADCEKGFVCRNRMLADNGVDMACVPAYAYNGKHAVPSCSAMLDMGTPCQWQAISDNEAACGADESGTPIDDAACHLFVSLTELVSYCTIHCVDDSECPAGWFCYSVPLSQDKVCKLQ